MQSVWIYYLKISETETTFSKISFD